MRFSQFASTLALFAVACATPGHPGAQPLRLTADNNFGARDDLMGNPLADRLEKVLAEKGPREMLALSSGQVFLAGFPSAKGPVVRPGMLAVKDSEGTLVPIVVPTQGVFSGQPRNKTHAMAHQSPEVANAVCQYLGYEKASRVMVRPITKEYCTGSQALNCRKSAQEYVADPKKVQGWSTVYNGRSAISGNKLGFISMGEGRYKSFPGFSDPIKVVKVESECRENDSRRLQCQPFDPNQVEDLYKPQFRSFGLVNRLTCSNADQRVGDLIRKALKMIDQESITPAFKKAIAAFKATESPQYLRELQQLNQKHPDHHMGDELRRLILPASTTNFEDAARFYYSPGVRDQSARDVEFKTLFYERVGLDQLWVLGMILADASNQKIAAALGSRSAKTRRFGGRERSFIESARLDLESSAYAQLADVYLANAKNVVAGQPIDAGILGPPPPQKKARRRKKAAAKPDPMVAARRLEGQLIKWFTADQIGPQGASDKDREKMMEAYRLLRGFRIQHRVDQKTPADFKRAYDLYVNIAIGREKEPAIKRLPLARGLSGAARARAQARETDRIMRALKRERKRQSEYLSQLRKGCGKMSDGGMSRPRSRSRSRSRAAKPVASEHILELRDHCLKRADRVAKPAEFKLPIPDKAWLDSQRALIGKTCQSEIDARLKRDLNELIAGGLLLEKCWPTIEDNMAIQRRISKLAKPLRGKVDKRIKGLIKQKDFISATSAAEDLEKLFGSKWVRGWRKKVAKAEAAWERKQARLSRKAKEKGIKACMKALSGPFLCSNASKLFCGRRCGHTSYCPCCTYGPEARRSACGG